MDENGDAGGNYTVLGSKPIKDSLANKTRFGLFPETVQTCEEIKRIMVR
jgi:hypothetical protein